MHPILASAGGSELPWFTPIVVSLLLVAVAGIYRLRHRRQGPGAGSDAFPIADEQPGADLPHREDPGHSSPFLLPRPLS